MTTDLLRPGHSNMSCIEGQCAFSSALMSTELEVSIEKKRYSVFEKLVKGIFVKVTYSDFGD